MKIFTYYINDYYHNQASQLKLIEAWQRNWSNAGFEAVVLGENDAKKYKFYEKVIEGCEFNNEAVIGKKLNRYDLACYQRWMAYAALDLDDFFYVSDYDVCNNIFDGTPPKTNSLVFLQGFCPSFVYGNSKLFADFCELFGSKYSKDKVTHARKIYSDEENRWIFRKHNDQDFILLNMSFRWAYGGKEAAKEIFNKYNLAIYPRFFPGTHENIVGEQIFDPVALYPKVSHFSSRFLYEYSKSHKRELTRTDLFDISRRLVSGIIK